MPEAPLVSIVVTSYTMERLGDILELLRSIERQTYANTETLLIVERSRALFDRLQEHAGMNTTVLFTTERGISSARNLGARNARGEIVGFVDDDVVLFPDWAEQMVRTYDLDSVIGVTGPAYPLWENESMQWFPEEFYWMISCTAWFDGDEAREVRNAWGHSMSFRREAFDYCLFSDTFGRTEGAHAAGKRGPVGDDTEFSMNLRARTGKAIIYNPAVKVSHKVYTYRLSRKFLRRQAYWQGYTKAMFRKLYRDKGVAGEDVLSTEQRLLRRIIGRATFGITRDLVRKPAESWRRFSLTVSVLLHLTLGYVSGVLPGLSLLTARAYR